MPTKKWTLKKLGKKLLLNIHAFNPLVLDKFEKTDSEDNISCCNINASLYLLLFFKLGYVSSIKMIWILLRYRL